MNVYYTVLTTRDNAYTHTHDKYWLVLYCMDKPNADIINTQYVTLHGVNIVTYTNRHLKVAYNLCMN